MWSHILEVPIVDMTKEGHPALVEAHTGEQKHCKRHGILFRLEAQVFQI